MQKNYISLGCLLLLFLLFNWQTSSAQPSVSSYTKVYDIMQAKCASCHSGDSPAAKLDLSQSVDDVFATLIDGEVVNPYAKEKGYTLVKPGDPDRSYLFRKCNNGLYKRSELAVEEGQTMPPYNGNGPLESWETEMIRQWILYGAKRYGEPVDETVLQEYYEAPEDHQERLFVEPPAPEEGFQLHLGTIFLKPNEEVEYYWKYDTQLAEDIEVNEVEVDMSASSHHFLFFKYGENDRPEEDPEGLEKVDFFNADIGEDMIGGWPYSKSYKLPAGTAYKWKEGTILKFNYHIKNYSSTQILPADLYINVYTQEAGTAVKEMYSDFILYRASLPCFIGDSFCIEPGETRTFEENITYRHFERDIDREEDINIWMLGGHTHKYGTDYDVFDVETGEQLYDGTFNYDDSDNIFDTGFYDYAEPPLRFFDDMVTVKGTEGIMHKATYENTGTSKVGFGLTTVDEMMGVFIQYVVGDVSELPTTPTAVDPNLNAFDWNIYPNPYAGTTLIQYNLDTYAPVELAIFNVQGQQVATLVQDAQDAGHYKVPFSAGEMGLAQGMYVARLTVDGVVYSKTLIEVE